MKKEVLIFGANAATGKGITKVFLEKDFDRIYLFASNFKGSKTDSEIVEKIEVKDLSVENNVIDAFNNLTPSKDTIFFLVSTIGGFTGGKYLWETPEEDFISMIDRNLKPALLISKHFSRLVQESAGGSICLTAAFTAVSPEVKKAPYGAVKAAMVHLVETLALEGKEINMSANALAPFIIDTPENRSWMKKTDFGSLMQPEEIGELVYDLFRNFHFITGNVIKLTHRIKF